MEPQNISTFSLGLCFILLIIPLLFDYLFQLKLRMNILISAARMGIQLVLMAFYLKYLLQWNNGLLNVAWLMLMILVAAGSVIKSSNIRTSLFILPVFFSLLISVGCLILYFNGIVLRLPFILDARYFIVVGGMFLGNSLRGNVIGISRFYEDLKRNEERYLYHLSVGASVREAVLPYFRTAMISSLNPSLASMATMGIVFLPGMMTGQILGGSTPITAIKYQIAIMIIIFVLLSLTVGLTIFFTLRSTFNSYGVLKKNIFRK